MSSCNVFSELLLHRVQFQLLRWCILWKPAPHQAYWCGFTPSSMKQASSICLPSHPPSLIHLPLLLLLHISFSCLHTYPYSFFIISVYRISLFCSFILLFPALSLQFMVLWHLAVCECMCECIQNQQILHYQVSQGAYDGMEICFSTPLNSPAVHVVCGSSGKDRESKVEEDGREGKERERRMWKTASRMA